MKSAHIILLSSNVISRRSHVRKNHTFKLITVVAIGFKSAFTCNRDEIPSKDEKISVYTGVSSWDETGTTSSPDEI